MLWPVVLTLVVHSCSALTLRASKSKAPAFVAGATPVDGALLRTNIGAFVVHVLCWTPLMVALATRRPHATVQHLERLAMAKSCLNPLVYAVCNKHFRDAFVSLFHYCCCKTSVSFSRRVSFLHFFLHFLNFNFNLFYFYLNLFEFF